MATDITQSQYVSSANKFSTTTETSTYQSLTTSRSTSVANPKGELDSQAFLNLLLKELEYQDPTSPMDTDKMLSQTSQLTALQAQNETTTAMKAMQTSLALSNQMNSTSAIGKIASLGTNQVTLTKGGEVPFGMHFAEPATNIQLTVKNSKGETVTQSSLGDTSSSYEELTWQGKDTDGNSLPAGTYTISATYADSTGLTKNADIAYMVDGVKFDSGKTLYKLGSNYVEASSIKEFYQ